MSKIHQVGSKSPIKIGAIKPNFSNHDIRKNTDITASSVNFKEYEQPQGIDVVTCGLNRLTNLINKYKPSFSANTQEKSNTMLDVIESGIFGDIENLKEYFGVNPKVPDGKQLTGLIKPSKDGNYYEHPVYIFHNPNNESTLVAYGTKVKRDTQSVIEAYKRGFDTTTISHIDKERGIITNDKDPHISITGTYTGGKPNDDGKPRADFMQEDIANIKQQYPDFFKYMN
jgi:hypothetical protein